MELVIDTETTGLTSLSFVTDRNYKKWPRLVQLAWAVIENGQIEIQKSAIIFPDKLKIPSDSVKIHGITQEQAVKEGVNLKNLLLELNDAMKSAATVIAHNLNFDLGILQSEAMRLNMTLEFPSIYRCTAFMGQTYLRKHKKMRLSEFPTLNQLHKTLLGYEHKSQHDAQSDVIACANVYLELKKLIEQGN